MGKLKNIRCGLSNCSARTGASVRIDSFEKASKYAASTKSYNVFRENLNETHALLGIITWNVDWLATTVARAVASSLLMSKVG